MNAMKKLFALLLALALVMSLAVPAMATSVSETTQTYTITLKDKMTGHQYEAYQIFSGDYHDKVLSNVQWGANFNADQAAAFITALKANELLAPSLEEVEMSDNASAAEVANWLAGLQLGYDAPEAQAFADIVHMTQENEDGTISYVFLTNQPYRATQGTTTDNEGKYSYTLSNVPGGYYLIKDKDNSQEGEHDFYTRLILQVSNSINVETKGAVPFVDKTVNNRIDGTYNQAVDVSAVDTVYFKLEGTLPSNYDKYEDYTYTFVDNMSPTLDMVYTEGNVASGIVQVYILHNSGSQTTLTIGGESGLKVGTSETEAGGNDLFISYNAVYSEDGKTHLSNQLKIKFYDLKTTLPGLLTDDKIVVKYAAKLNGNAIIGMGGADGKGNENEVVLEFSNNPQGSGTGKTTEDTAEVYTYELRINKVDDSGSGTLLAGAEFLLANRITEDASVPAGTPQEGAVVDQLHDYLYPVFQKDETNNIYGLYDWIMTDVPIREYEEVVENGVVTARYALDQNGVYVTEKGTNNRIDLTNYLMVSTESNPIKLQGIDAGTYWLREIREPVGYNILKEPISVTITATLNETTGVLSSIVSNVNGHESNGDVVHGIAPATIVNTGGAVLPSTGGIGTTIFYVAGGLLAAAAIVLLITKKRMSEN